MILPRLTPRLGELRFVTRLLFLGTRSGVLGLLEVFADAVLACLSSSLRTCGSANFHMRKSRTTNDSMPQMTSFHAGSKRVRRLLAVVDRAAVGELLDALLVERQSRTSELSGSCANAGAATAETANTTRAIARR